MTRFPKLITAVLLLSLGSCRTALRLTPSDADTVLSRQLLEAPNPALPGERAVRTLYYGSGTDRRRPEYRDSVAIRTPTVDASKLVDLGKSAKQRNDYWGFTPKEMPLNGRVWYPDGQGPFPLVLIVHGNHNMKDYSDPGYRYLGELLASRGYILASVDENFLNGSIRGENDARGWMLLKHLQQWREWSRTPGNPFEGKVDLKHIALIGHSRGGEAVAIAAAFNRLPRYPDDANLTFDFGFDIRSVIAIAPVDGQYMPAGQRTPVENVDYMVFEGSHDGDVSSFHGLRQYHRVRFTDGEPHFKTAIYVYRANHGQWNLIWGAHDSGPRSARILDLRGLLSAAQQRQFAKVYISAFLDATLRDDRRYLPLFIDDRVIGGWLPKTMYITRFRAGSFRPLADYEEDIDVTSGSIAGVRLRGDSLASWHEGELELRSRNRNDTPASQTNQAVWIGWNNHVAGPDTTVLGTPARYAVELPDTLARAWHLGGATSLQIDLAPTRDVPLPRTAAADTTAPDSTVHGKKPNDNDGEPSNEPVDLSVEVVDAAGHAARVQLRNYGPVRRPLEMHVMRRADQDRKFYPQDWELILQTYTLPLSDFRRAATDLDLERLREVRLVFDGTSAGTVVVDDIGFANLDPAFTAVRVPAPGSASAIRP